MTVNGSVEWQSRPGLVQPNLEAGRVDAVADIAQALGPPNGVAGVVAWGQEGRTDGRVGRVTAKFHD